MGKRKLSEWDDDTEHPHQLPIPKPVSSGPRREIPFRFYNPDTEQQDLFTPAPEPEEEHNPETETADNTTPREETETAHVQDQDRPVCVLCNDSSRPCDIYSTRAGGPVHNGCHRAMMDRITSEDAATNPGHIPRDIHTATPCAAVPRYSNTSTR